MTKMSNKYMVSLESLKKWSQLYPTMTVKTFIELFLK